MSSKLKHKRRSGYSYRNDVVNFRYGQAVTGRWAYLDAMRKRERNAALNEQS